MKFSKRIFNSTFGIFLVIAVLYAVGNYIWWMINTPIIPGEMSALHFLDIFTNENLFYNAPLLTWIMKGMFFIFGKEYYDLIVIFVNYIFFLIPLYFIYKLGVELKDKETGNIAMILFALVPAVYGMSRQYGHQDYHIIAGITFNIYCLIKTDYFRDRKWTIWYGISVGLGLMIKDAFLAYFFVPFIYIVIKGLKEKTDRAKVINVFMSILSGSLIAGWHYFRPDIIQKIWYEPVTDVYFSIITFESLRVMTIGLWEDLLSPPIFIIFVIALIFFIFKYKGRYKNVILMWFFVPWSIIMFMPHYKVPEYGAGFIPAMILMGAVFISQIQKKYVKRIILILLIAIGFLQYIDFSYVRSKNLFNMWFKCNTYFIGYYNKYNTLISHKKKHNKQISNLVKYLKNNYSGNEFYFVEKYGYDFYSITIQLRLNNINFEQGYYDNRNMLLYPIILLIGQPERLKEAIDNKINIIFKKPVDAKIFNEESKNKMIRDMEYIFNELENNYYIIDIFCLDKKNNTNITLLGRKDKFLKYKRF
ncbi:MAG: glycosyltransferase family 39 protein [Endomicrobiaceae bacterium]|jgi:hypothetical protein|nr:glycosyltransferase family 39 protein [Endomicrobiaceae bacterium]MDD3729816.1 glycosyltransferase family 39 protein [Endomicrobiaceae bacterium]MDD4165907.1 glycosyltransferase family 39 protein [Endomicrobiaceae bacterium]